MFYFFFFIQKTENNIFLEKRWPTFYDIIFLFLLVIGSVGPVDQQINLVSLKRCCVLAFKEKSLEM